MSDNVVEITDLSRRFGHDLALDRVTLAIPRGAVFAMVGENGAGKTTLIKHVLGLLKAQHGTVRVFGKDPVKHPVEVLSQIGYLSEDRDLPDWMSVGQLLRYNQAFFSNWDMDFAGQLCETFKLDRQQKIKRLSRGQRARTGLLVALAHRPDLLILDEPSSGLDPFVRRDILGAIIRTVAQEGRTVLFSSHLLEEVERVADIVAMIHHGQIVLCDSLETIVAAHRRVVIRFDEPQLTAPRLPGALACTGEGPEWTAVCNGQIDELRRAAQQAGATIVEEETASLNEIFMARVTG